jgi:hypothetical protein
VHTSKALYDGLSVISVSFRVLRLQELLLRLSQLRAKFCRFFYFREHRFDLTLL